VGVALGAVAPFALVLGQSAELGSGRKVVPLVALVALLAVRWLVQRAAGGPGLTALGVATAGVAAWLVPQRPDVVSTVLLAALFGAGAGLVGPGHPREGWDGPIPSDGVVRAAGLGALAVIVVLRIADASTVLLVIAVVLVAIAGALRPDRRRAGDQRRRSRVLRLTAVAAPVVLVGGGYVAYLGASTPDAGWFGGGLVHGDRSKREVALTFDDGPNVSASLDVAKILDRYGTKGTFFMVGKAIDADPGIVRQLHADGQLLGGHSYDHDSWSWLDPWYRQLPETNAAFERAIHTCPAFYRVPHGQRTPFVEKVASDHGQRLVMWDVSAGDWATDDAGLVARRILAGVKPGSIILLHDGLDGHPEVDRRVLVRALPMILDGLKAKGLKPVRLDQLVGGPSSRPC
jgi:peptidoglycan/xylan/chitin deacetylase (PgdA/CDA1 family)